jgi:adenylosuccinate synthase
LRRGKVCVIGNGVVVDPVALLYEIQHLREQGIKINDNLKISAQAHVIFPYHRIFDRLRESKRGKERIGTTGRGIGPCYADKVARCGIRFADLLNAEVFKRKLLANVKEKNAIFSKIYNHPGFRLRDIYEEYTEYTRRLKHYICDTALFLNRAIKAKKNILFEGAQGTFLDVDFGTYPFVTSSNATVGGVCSGSGVSPRHIDRVIGIVKAYTTRVGKGPFPTEFTPLLMSKVRCLGKEFGATTGRPRRCGWLDVVLLRYAAMVNGLNELAVTKLDVLDRIPRIKICVAYKYAGRIFKDFPAQSEILKKCQPVYEEHRGWMKDTGKTDDYKELPLRAKKYLKRIQQLIGVKIAMVSVGSEREQLLKVKHI